MGPDSRTVYTYASGSLIQEIVSELPWLDW